MTTTANSLATADIQSRGDLIAAFPQTDWAAAFDWLPRFAWAGGFVTDESMGITVQGLTADGQLHAVAVQDEWQDIFCGTAAVLALAQYQARSVDGSAPQ